MKRTQVWIPMLLSVSMIAGMWIGFSLRKNIPETRGFFQVNRRSSVQEVADLINREYVDSVNTDSLSEDAIMAMVRQLDPHSIYLPPVDAIEASNDLKGNFEGIGVEYQIIDDTVCISGVLENGPSDKAGLKVGDKIVKVGDSLVAGNGITNDKIKSLLRGESQSPVSVSLLRDRKMLQVQITRGLIPTYSVDASYMIDKKTGYIHLNKFSQTSYEEFMAATEKLQKQGMQQMMLDLRGNGGGILDEAVDIADEFLSGDKLVVYTQGLHSPRRNYTCKRPGIFEKGKLVVLIDAFSASASEVLAGALQDWDRASIVGRRSFAKGLVQEPFELANGAQLRLTVARYYTPAGRNIQKSFDHGRDAYNEEVFERIHMGNTDAEDSASHTGKAYKTLVKKRTVYGGGGITPDYYVAMDSSSISDQLASLLYDQAFNEFIYRYYLQRKGYFDRFKSPTELADNFQPGPDTWQALKAVAEKDSIAFDPLSSQDKEKLAQRIKLYMARQIWRMQGYYEVNNLSDKIVEKAREVLEQP